MLWTTVPETSPIRVSDFRYIFALIRYAFAEANCLWCYQQQNTECMNFHDTQTHARTALSCLCLRVMTKINVTAQDNFQENEHIKGINGLGVQRLDLILTFIYVTLQRAFKSKTLLLTIRTFWRECSPGFICESLFAVLLLLVLSILRSSCAFNLHPGMRTTCRSFNHLVWEKILHSHARKQTWHSFSHPHQGMMSTSSAINCIYCMRYTAVEIQGLIRQSHSVFCVLNFINTYAWKFRW